MWALLNWRIWALAVVLVLYPISYMKGRSDGRKLERADTAQAVAQADKESRQIEERRRSNVDAAQRSAAAREIRLRADAARARDSASGLRDDLRAAELYAAQSSAAADKAIRVTTGLLEQCTALYLGVSEDAARADLEARELRAAWPK